MRRWIGRLCAVGAGFVAAMTITGIAYAHVEVEIEPAVAGSTNATLTMDAAAESNSAGVSSVRIVLPAGIAPTDLTLKSGPNGWTLSPTSDGYTVGGPALPVGENAVHSVTVARLPEATTLVFKALVNYTDGSVDRWIEEPSTANPRPENPAPVVTLAPNPNPAPTVAPTTPPAITPPATTPAPTAAAAAAPDNPDNSGNGWLWWVLGAVVVVAVVVASVLLRRRGPATF